MDIICFSNTDWDNPLWTNKQHIMSRLAKKHRVVYVDPGLIGAAVGRIRRGETSWYRPFRWVREPVRNLWVVSPLLLPLTHGRFLKRVGWRVARWHVRRLARRIGFMRPIVWVYLPEAIRALDAFQGSLVLYDCVDDFASTPYYSSSRRRQAGIMRLERELLKRSDLVIVTSEQLYEDKRRYNPNTHLVHNVADAHHFARARGGGIPKEMQSLRRPIVGFVGALSEYKVDYDLLEVLFRSRPDWSFALVGPLESMPPKGRAVADLPNVHLLGTVVYDRVPQFVAAFDVCIIPYRVSRHTSRVFPLKLFEFLASGRPVVSTPLPAYHDYRHVLRLAEDPEGFVSEIEDAIADPGDEEERVAVALENTWEKRIDSILPLIQETRKTGIQDSQERPGPKSDGGKPSVW